MLLTRPVPPPPCRSSESSVGALGQILMRAPSFAPLLADCNARSVSDSQMRYVVMY
jgi:hypothetical protein